ncbi:MAG: Asp-tRNA(Asn)/Glu-tRNA(Gln) amidotransferase subunit GatC [bacterium]|nr:Asp-tRNA(Asn)/Glu-tRNA(Gln) amidotransferase subunit GatC [bacterium]
MSLSIAEVRKIAHLARISLTEAEEKRHAATISAVLDYMKILNEVDTAGVEPTFQVTGLEDVLREDKVHESKIKNELVAAFPEKSGSLNVVPAVFE